MVSGIILSSSLKSFIQLLGVLVIFLFVLLITYVVTRWIAGYQKGHMAGQNLQLIETMRIANNKFVQIIQAGEIYLVIAVGKDDVCLLAKLTAEQLLELPSGQTGSSGTPDFQDILDKLKEHLPKKKD